MSVLSQFIPIMHVMYNYGTDLVNIDHQKSA